MEQFTLKDEILYYIKEATDVSIQCTLVVPHSLKQKALSQAHEKSGHLGEKKTIKKAEELFYWCNLKVHISNYVKKCITCQRFKGQTGLQQPFQELPSVGKPLERIGIDLTDMISGSQCYSVTGRETGEGGGVSGVDKCEGRFAERKLAVECRLYIEREQRGTTSPGKWQVRFFIK